MSTISISNQIISIKKDINNIGMKIVKEVAKDANNDLINVHRQIVDNFYSSYTPVTGSYARTKNLYNSIIPQPVMSTKTKGIAEIVVSSFSMNDNYNISPDNVFDLFWNKGVRGLPKVGTRTLADGETWKNPTWKSKYGEYGNVFKTMIVLGNYVSVLGTPHQVMSDIVNHWGEAKGKESCEKAVNKIKI